MIAVEFEDLPFCKHLHLSSCVSSFLYFLQFSWVSFHFMLVMLVSDFMVEQNWYGEKAGIWQYPAARNVFYNNLLFIHK